LAVDFQLNLNAETVARLEALPPLCVEPGLTVREVLKLLQARRRSTVLICREGLLVGIFTERDALKLMAVDANLDVPVENVMARNPVVVAPEDSVGDAISKMSRGGYRRLPIVTRDGVPTGVLSVRQILRYLVEHFPMAIYTLPPSPNEATKDREGA
jgi:CBS domain-containing protein